VPLAAAQQLVRRSPEPHMWHFGCP
jgi:hypothetical protein